MSVILKLDDFLDLCDTDSVCGCVGTGAGKAGRNYGRGIGLSDLDDCYGD